MSVSENVLDRKPSAVSHSAVGGSLSGILGKCSDAFKRARSNVFEATALLYQIREKNAWEAHFNSFSEYVEGELGISKGYASKLLSVYEHFVLKAGVSHAKLTEAEPERLYLSMQLPMEPGQQLIRASTWTRQEMKAELARDEHGNEHTCEAIQICKTCGRRM